MLTVVIPVFNEAKSLAELFGELNEMAKKNDISLDVIFVDDGSTDDTWREVVDLAQGDARVRGIRFRRNFGKAAALSAGFREARGEIVVTMDGDLQDDPREIPRLMAELENGFDVVSEWKKVRRDSWSRVWASRVFNAMVSGLTGVKLHDHNSGMKCYRRAVVKDIRLYGELHRFVPVLAAARGWRVGELAVNHRPRKYGRSKYGAQRFAKGFLDLVTVKFLTGFGQRPQHMLGMVGLVFFGLGAVVLLVLTGAWVVTRLDGDVLNDIHLHERAVFYYAIVSLLFGSQFMSVGLLAELVNSRLGRESDSYAISESVGK